MMKQHIEQIRAHEHEARERLREAQLEAERIVEQARIDGERLIEDTKAAGAELRRARAADAHREAEALVAGIRSEAGRDSVRLAETADRLRERAIGLIIDSFRKGF